MAAVAGFPSLSQLPAWPAEHLTEAAEHWEAIGERSYGVANKVWRDALRSTGTARPPTRCTPRPTPT